MRAIIQSINPEHIFNMRVEQAGVPLKRIEVRKTSPDVEFKAFIYCTSVKNLSLSEYVRLHQATGGDIDNWSGKVVGEYICRRIEDVRADNAIAVYYNNKPETRITDEQLRLYGAKKPLRFLHMEEVIFYDKPKDLSEFKKEGFMTEEQWLYALYPNTHCHYAAWAKKFDINRPPQSWCYAMEVRP